MRNLIKGRMNETLGYTIDQGDRKELHSRAGRFLGYYSESQDKTYRASGAFVGYGDQLMLLLEN